MKVTGEYEYVGELADPDFPSLRYHVYTCLVCFGLVEESKTPGHWLWHKGEGNA